jgi:LmbE family N-acetylglucosaminyl deacetylase
MINVLVVAPHPDDETLGCGGTLYRHIQNGDKVYWLICTTIVPGRGYSEERISSRSNEIIEVASLYGFAGYKQLNFPTTELDQVPKNYLVEEISNYVSEVDPHTVYLPYRNDAHSDHANVFDASVACTKTFRYPSVKKVYAYETLSETEFGLRHDDPGFKPNKWVDISSYMDSKINVLNVYKSEIKKHPFPRSEKAILSLGILRGIVCGCEFAEAFITLKDIS